MNAIVCPSDPGHRCWIIAVVVLMLVVVIGSPSALGLIMVSKGNAPAQDHGWPAGAVDVANLKYRLGYWEGPPFGGGEYHFEYTSGTQPFQQALDLFAKIDSPQLVVILHEGPIESTFLDDATNSKAKARYDWSFTIWDPASYKRLFLDPKSAFLADSPNFHEPLPAPQLDVYLGGAPAGEGIDWARVKVPPNVTVTDERASSNGYAGKGSVLRGQIANLDDGKPIVSARVLLTKYTGKQGQFDDVASAKSAADGKFELTGVPPGSFRIHAAADGYVPRQLGYAKFGKDTLKEFPAVKLSPPLAVMGTVTDLESKPLKDLSVSANNVIGADGKGYTLPVDLQAKTDAQGRFTLRALPKGSCLISVRSPGLHMLDPLKMHSIPADNIAIRVGVTGTVRGRVPQAAGGGPYTASITPEGGNKVGSWGGSCDVKPDGSFTFENVPPGRYIVTASPNPGRVVEGKDPNERLVEVKPGATADVEIVVK